jgi:hypothetical protein
VVFHFATIQLERSGQFQVEQVPLVGITGIQTRNIDWICPVTRPDRTRVLGQYVPVGCTSQGGCDPSCTQPEIKPSPPYTTLQCSLFRCHQAAILLSEINKAKAAMEILVKHH